MNLSIVIPVSTDEKIGSCLSSINENVEVVVVMNSPSKEVIDILEKEKRKNLTFVLRVFKIKDRNISKARNFGVKKATHSNTLFIDSDCVLDKDCLRIMNNSLVRTDIVKGGVILGNVFQNILPNDFFTPNLGIKKHVFEKLGGFDQSIKWSEDLDFSLRINMSHFRKIQTKNAFVHHPKSSIFTYCQQFFRYGLGYAQIDKKYGNFKCLKRSLDAISLNKIFMAESFERKIRRLTGMPLRVLAYFWSYFLY